MSMTTPDPADLPLDPALDARLTELRNRFRGVLPQRMDSIVTRLATLGVGVWDGAIREDLKTEVHSLAGSAGLFGYEQIGVAASALERLIMRVAKQPAASQAVMDDIQSLVSRLKDAVDAA